MRGLSPESPESGHARKHALLTFLDNLESPFILMVNGARKGVPLRHLNMTDDQPASPAPPAESNRFNRSDDRDPLAIFPTETEVAAAQQAVAREATANRKARLAATAPRPRRRGRPWLGFPAVAVLVTAAAAAVWLAAPNIASVTRSRLPGPVPQPQATLVVETTPPGWDVTEGERRLGATPLTVSLPPGSHSLVLRHGTTARPLAVTLRAGTQIVHHLDMTGMPAAPTVGALQVTTVPPGAAVGLDGAMRGAAPLHIANLAPGEHTIVVANAYRVVNQKVTITAGETTTLLVPLGQPPAPARWAGWPSRPGSNCRSTRAVRSSAAAAISGSR